MPEESVIEGEVVEDNPSMLAAQFGVVFDMVPGLDGTTWPRMQIVYGISAYTITMPAKQFEQFLSHMGKEGKRLMQEIQRANSPIKTFGSMPDNLRDSAPGKNGRHR